MTIVQFLGDVGTGITTYLPALIRAMVDGFVGMFFTEAEGAITGLNPLGTVSISFFVVGLCGRLVPTIAGWLKLRSSKKTKKRKK